MKYAAVLCATLLASALVMAQNSKPPSPFERELIDQEKQFLSAIEDKNGGQVAQLVSEDFRGIGTNGDFYEKSELVGTAQSGLPKGTSSYEFEVVKLDDSSAVVAYNMVVPGAHPRYRHMADTWAKIDGQWRLKFQQITPNLWSAKDFD